MFLKIVLRAIIVFWFLETKCVSNASTTLGGRAPGIFEIAERVIIDDVKTFATSFVDNFSSAIFGGRGERFDGGARSDERSRRKARALSRFRSLDLQG